MAITGDYRRLKNNSWFYNKILSVFIFIVIFLQFSPNQIVGMLEITISIF